MLGSGSLNAREKLAHPLQWHQDEKPKMPASPDSETAVVRLEAGLDVDAGVEGVVYDGAAGFTPPDDGGDGVSGGSFLFAFEAYVCDADGTTRPYADRFRVATSAHARGDDCALIVDIVYAGLCIADLVEL